MNLDQDIFMDESDPDGDAILKKYEDVSPTTVIPNPVWKWNVLGIPMGMVFYIPDISWWQRLWCRFFFGSTFDKIGKE